ncbi:hypothetical protein [Komagataeibacter sp. SM21]|uniref:hypothetical protein n=1 Tax=Komagataeibacter sp. SM21 TaxID=3242899 RepID=UPI00352704A2
MPCLSAPPHGYKAPRNRPGVLHGHFPGTRSPPAPHPCRPWEQPRATIHGVRSGDGQPCPFVARRRLAQMSRIHGGRTACRSVRAGVDISPSGKGCGDFGPPSGGAIGYGTRCLHDESLE